MVGVRMSRWKRMLLYTLHLVWAPSTEMKLLELILCGVLAKDLRLQDLCLQDPCLQESCM